MERRVEKICGYLSELKNVTVDPIDAGKYLFPRVYFSKRAISAAGSMSVDNFYC